MRENQNWSSRTRGSEGDTRAAPGMLMGLQEVLVRPVTPAHLESIIGPDRTAHFEATAETTRNLRAGRSVLNVNSTATGGGVAELLQTLLANVCAVGVDARWVVIDGNPDFFAITKRIHNHLYGTAGDGGELGSAERQSYETTLAPSARELLKLARPGDVVLLHDPQTAGSSGRINRPVDLLGTGPPPPADVPIVLQASRWDALKDMPGVMIGFAEHMEDMGTAHLVLAGPSVDGVADDPEAAQVLQACLEIWRTLPDAARRRVHLACVSMIDCEEAAATVDALQRHAAVVVQKTVAGLVAAPAEADRLGLNGQRHASEYFLGDRHLQQWAQVLAHQIH